MKNTGGRPKTLSSSQIEAAHKMFISSQYSIEQIIEYFGISRATFFRIRKGWKNPILKIAIDDFLKTSANTYMKIDSRFHRMVGYDLTFMKVLGRLIKSRITLVPTRFDQLIPKATRGEVDVAMGWLNDTPNRKKLVAFSETYITPTPPCVFILARRDLDINWQHPSTLTGKVVGVQVGTTHESYARKNWSSLSEIKTYIREQAMFKALFNREIHMVVAHENEFSDFLNKNSNFERKLPAIDYKAQTCLALAQENQPLLENINEALKFCRTSGLTDLTTEYQIDRSLDQRKFHREVERILSFR